TQPGGQRGDGSPPARAQRSGATTCSPPMQRGARGARAPPKAKRLPNSPPRRGSLTPSRLIGEDPTVPEGRLVQRVLQNCLPDAPRLAQHRRQPRDQLERVAVFDQPLELGDLVLEPGRVDGRPPGTLDLEVGG